MIQNPNINISEAKAEDIESVVKVHIQSWRDSFQSIIAQEYLDNMSQELGMKMRSEIMADKNMHKINLVVKDKNKVIGFCDAGLTKDRLRNKG